jgi:hypothetical protein
LGIATDDLGSKPMINASIDKKMPPKLLNAAPNKRSMNQAQFAN